MCGGLVFESEVGLVLLRQMQKNVKLSCVLAVLALSWPVSIALALDEASREAQAATSVTGYYEFLQSLWPLAEQKAIRRVTFDLAFAGLTPDPAAPAASNRQAEFDKPLKSYLDEAVSPRRIARGRECLNRWQDELQQIERRFGVPREILLAAFGIETDFYANPVGSPASPGEPKGSCPKISALPRYMAASPPLPRGAPKAPTATHFRKATQPCSSPPAPPVQLSFCRQITGFSRRIIIRTPTLFRLACSRNGSKANPRRAATGRKDWSS